MNAYTYTHLYTHFPRLGSDGGSIPVSISLYILADRRTALPDSIPPYSPIHDRCRCHRKPTSPLTRGPPKSPTGVDSIRNVSLHRFGLRGSTAPPTPVPNTGSDNRNAISAILVRQTLFQGTTIVIVGRLIHRGHVIPVVTT